ncbi:L-cystatin-like [Uloborus diversus]|uniref:L-cystatin-like n=1 Tax=Uloborus diversus TaxID=327109 RepID=UPI00240936A8|nr:L-cystatin-like [Uloborus diversus]
MAKIAFILLIFSCIFLFEISGAMMTGAYSRKQVNSTDVKQYADFAVAELSKKMNSPYHWKTQEILGVQTQVVSGVNYKINVTMGATECKKNQSKANLEQCEFLESMEPKTCEFTVWVQAWKEGNERTKLTHSSCQ